MNDWPSPSGRGGRQSKYERSLAAYRPFRFLNRVTKHVVLRNV